MSIDQENSKHPILQHDSSYFFVCFIIVSLKVQLKFEPQMQPRLLYFEKQNLKMNVCLLLNLRSGTKQLSIYLNLKTRALTRSISSNPHSVAKRSWRLLYNTWTRLTPSSVTHVNSYHVIVLTDSHTAVTNHPPARPDTRMYLQRKVIYHTRKNVFDKHFRKPSRQLKIQRTAEYF